MLPNSEESYSFSLRLASGKYMETDNAGELSAWYERNKSVTRRKRSSVDKTELKAAATDAVKTGAFVIESDREAPENVS